MPIGPACWVKSSRFCENTSFGVEASPSSKCGRKRNFRPPFTVPRSETCAWLTTGRFFLKLVVLPARMAHMSGHLTFDFLSGIVEIMAFGFQANGFANCIFQWRVAF